MPLWLRWPVTTLPTIAGSPTARPRPRETLPAMLTVAVAAALSRSGPAATTAAIVAAKIPVSTTTNRELRQRTRVLLPFRARQRGANQLPMNRAVLDLWLTVVVLGCHWLRVLDAVLRLTLGYLDSFRRFRRLVSVLV